MADTTYCSNCGTALNPETNLCPQCSAQPEGFVGKLLATTKTHRTYWMIGGGVVVAAAAGLVLMYGGFFGFSGREICTATLTQAKDFGVISPSADLDSTSAKSTDVKNRRSCTAKAGEDLFTMLVDVKSEDVLHKPCKDLKKQGSCVALWSVSRADGATTYQVREIPPEESDEALAAQAQQQASQVPPPPGAAPPSGEASPFDTDTAVDNSTAPTGPATQPPAEQQPQQQ